MQSKKGQFYLIATIIIIGIIAGFAFVSNYSSSKISTNFQQIEREVSIESAKVVDYAIANEKNPDDLLKNFTRDYSAYSDADTLYFIFGKTNNITLAGYSRFNPSIVTINFGSGDQQVNFNQGTYQTFNYAPMNTSIIFKIGNLNYKFNLTPVENFYFVISKNLGEEKYVVTNEDSDSGVIISNEEFTQLTCIQYITPQFCQSVVSCPEGSEVVSDITSCSCGLFGLGCKHQYTCGYIQYTSCTQNPECPSRYSSQSSQSCNP